MGEQAAPFGPQYGFGLYVHWPYCSKICPYCDFNVYAAKTRSTEPLLKAIAEDIRIHRPRMPEHGALDTVYFGGGPPSLLARITWSASDASRALRLSRPPKCSVKKCMKRDAAP